MNKKVLAVGLVIFIVVILALATMPMSATDKHEAKKTGTTIQDGILTYSSTHFLADEPLIVGYDPYGYNYQGHMFVGSYANSYLGGSGYPPYEGDDDAYLAENPSVVNTWFWPYRDVQLMMKWNDAWLSNMDCDGDGKLDRYFGHPSYDGSGAWLTNYQSGSYFDEDNNEIKWNYYVKIITPSTANGDVKMDGVWYQADGTLIGPVIWGAFAIIQQVENDPGIGAHGLQFNSASPTGFGYYD